LSHRLGIERHQFQNLRRRRGASRTFQRRHWAGLGRSPGHDCAATGRGRCRRFALPNRDPRPAFATLSRACRTASTPFSGLARSPCFRALSFEFCLAAGLRGPVECWAFLRARRATSGYVAVVCVMAWFLLG
jgi:hypothetical protein